MLRHIRRYSKKYGDTLFLPQTGLKNRPSPQDTQRFLKETGEDLYKWQSVHRKDADLKVFQDGPPYANGELHLGHALNKVLKDFVNRYNVMIGHRVKYRPGWDCHGLPIEQAALEKARKKHGGAKVAAMSMAEKRQLARDLALSMVEKQKQAFQQFGVMADWSEEGTYKTLTIDYVIRQLKVFRGMVAKGLISRQDRPVYWSVESGTALAESELEYGEKQSQTVTVKYPIATSGGQFRGLENVHLTIWTTTPWTLVANRAIAVNPDIEYGIYLSDTHGHIIVAVERSGEIVNSDGSAVTLVSGPFKGQEMIGLKYRCGLRDPAGNNEEYPVLPASYVVATSGTGLVHNAPGHGKEDYLLCKEHGILPFSPINDKGQYVLSSSSSSSVDDLHGLDARTEGQQRVLEKLRNANMVVAESTIVHSVPFDWRSKKPVMVRSTPQFFADVGSIKAAALKALDSVKFYPETGRNRLEAFTTSRSEWCVSRQRAWGVPIPAFLDKTSNTAILTAESVNAIVNRLEQLGDEGLRLWFDAAEQDISHWLPESLRSRQSEFVKCNEILDVWFDSGTAWTMEPTKVNEPEADYYLEGSDQHRGWFQSSLLTRVAVQNVDCDNNLGAHAPFKNVITHGFILDAKGQKMSKSLGNVVTPQELIAGGKTVPTSLGIDGMRLWISQADYASDVVLSNVIIGQVASLVKKLRVTFKFLLGNLKGSTHTASSEVQSSLTSIDRYTLSRLAELNTACKADYESFAFNRVVKRLQAHMSSELSALYFDVVKDRLYADSISSPRRVATQHVLAEILKLYCAILAPITPLLCQEVWQFVPETVKQDKNHTSPFMAQWPATLSWWTDRELEKEFDALREVRKTVQETLEAARTDKNVRSSLASEVYLNIQSDKAPHLEEIVRKYQSELAELFIVSAVHVNEPVPDSLPWKYANSSAGYTVTAVPPTRAKCPRCWQYTSESEEELCNRCEEVVCT